MWQLKMILFYHSSAFPSLINIFLVQIDINKDISKFEQVFRWFKFTLKPPYSGAHERSLLAIWDTSHWNFFVKFGLRTA